MKPDAMIGLEIHLPLNRVRTKLFCRCSLPNQTSEPNTFTCPICLAMPGAKPSANKYAIMQALKLALCLKAKIAQQVIFSRKQYMYPDLPANFQRTQYEMPIATGGFVVIEKKKIMLKRLHIEEDPGSLIHIGGIRGGRLTLVDYNRSGLPLCEIVTEPDISSVEEAKKFLGKLLNIVDYLGIYDSHINPVKCDVNISIKESNYTRVEIKNISGFHEIGKAISYELLRQKQENAVKETRAWSPEKGITFPLRKKEDEEDYGYIFEPDLPPIDITRELIENIKKGLPEMPDEKITRYVSELKIPKEDAEVIASDYELALLFERCAKQVDSCLAAKWTRRELSRVLNFNGISAKEIKTNPIQLVKLLKMLQDKKITERTGQRIIEKLVVEEIDVEEHIREQGLFSLSDKSLLSEYCRQAIEENRNAAEDYMAGKTEAINFLLGAVMRKSRGKVDAREAKKILLNQLRKKS